MEEKRGSTNLSRSQSSSGLFPTAKERHSFFQSYFKAEAKRFSRNVIANCFSADQKKVLLKIFVLFLQKEPETRDEQDCEAVAKVLQEEEVFPQFNNDIKVLRMLAKAINVKRIEARNYLFQPNTKDDNMHKILQGSVRVSKQENSKEFEQRSKGNFIQDAKSFKQIKEFFALCWQETYFLTIQIHKFTQILNFYLKKKVILKMLHQTPLLASLNKKQIQFVFQNSVEKELIYKQYLFCQGDSDDEHIYLLIEGQLSVILARQGKQKSVCKLFDGSIIGDENVVLSLGERAYTARLISQKGRLIVISRRVFHQALKMKGSNQDSFNFQTRYDKIVRKRLQHYVEYLLHSDEIKRSFHLSQLLKPINPQKNKRINNIAKVSDMLEERVFCLQKIVSKRSNFKTCHNKINFSMPLFCREDFPELETSLKRFANEEKYALQRFKLPKIR